MSAKKESNSSKNSEPMSKGLQSSSSKDNKKKTNKKGGGELLLKLPAGLEYRLPGKRQRVFLGATVVGLNLILVIAVIVYFYSPSFQEFVYNVGKN